MQIRSGGLPLSRKNLRHRRRRDINREIDVAKQVEVLTGEEGRKIQIKVIIRQIGKEAYLMSRDVRIVLNHRDLPEHLRMVQLNCSLILRYRDTSEGGASDDFTRQGT